MFDFKEVDGCRVRDWKDIRGNTPVVGDLVAYAVRVCNCAELREGIIESITDNTICIQAVGATNLSRLSRAYDRLLIIK